MSSSAKWRKHLMWNIFLANCSVKHILWTHILWNTFCEMHSVKQILWNTLNLFRETYFVQLFCEIHSVIHVQLVSWNIFLAKSQIVQWNISLSESNLSVKQYSNCSVKHICALIQIKHFAIYFSIWTSTFCNLDKYVLQFGYIHFVMWNICLSKSKLSGYSSWRQCLN